MKRSIFKRLVKAGHSDLAAELHKVVAVDAPTKSNELAKWFKSWSGRKRINMALEGTGFMVVEDNAHPMLYSQGPGYAGAAFTVSQTDNEYADDADVATAFYVAFVRFTDEDGTDYFFVIPRSMGAQPKSRSQFMSKYFAWISGEDFTAQAMTKAWDREFAKKLKMYAKGGVRASVQEAAIPPYIYKILEDGIEQGKGFDELAKEIHDDVEDFELSREDYDEMVTKMGAKGWYSPNTNRQP